MRKPAVKIPPAFQWPSEGLKTAPEAHFRISSPWLAQPEFKEGADYRLIDTPGAFNPIPTIAITASPTSNTFWALQAAAAQGKVRLRQDPTPSTVPATGPSFSDSITMIALAPIAIVAGAAMLIKGIIPSYHWDIQGEGPWRYAKFVTFNESRWLDQFGINEVRGSLMEVKASPIGKPCGYLEYRQFLASSRLALPTGDDHNYIYIPRSLNHRILYDSDIQQFYLEAKSGSITYLDGVDVYRRKDVRLETLLPIAGFTNTSPLFVKAHQLSHFTLNVFETARQFERPVEQGGRGFSEAESLRWAAKELRNSWTYEESNIRRLRIMLDGEGSYSQFHNPDGITTTECATAATEFFHAARAFGYNVRLAAGYSNRSDCSADKTTCHFTSNFLHNWVEYADAAGKVYIMEAQPNMKAPYPDNDRDQKIALKIHASEREAQRLLLMPNARLPGGVLITLDTIQPILQAMTDPTLMGDLEPVVAIPSPEEHEEFMAYPRANYHVLPTRQHYKKVGGEQDVRMTSMAYEALEAGDQILWSPKLGQFVLKTDAPNLPRRLRVWSIANDCLTSELLHQLPAACHAQVMSAEAPLTPQPDHVPEELRRIFEELRSYAQFPHPHLALRPAEVLAVAFDRWLDLKLQETAKNRDSKDVQGQKWEAALSEGLPPSVDDMMRSVMGTGTKTFLTLSNSWTLSFFAGARALGYPVELVVKSAQFPTWYSLQLQLRDHHETFTISDHSMHTSEQAEQRMAWMDQYDPQVHHFFSAMQGQQTATEADVFAGFAGRVAGLPPMMAAVPTRENSWEPQFIAITPNLKIRPPASRYTVSAPPLQSEVQALTGWQRLDEDDYRTATYLSAGRRIQVRLLHTRNTIHTLTNTQGDPIPTEALSQTPFFRVADTDVYFNPTLDLAFHADVVLRMFFKNAQGQIVTFLWQFPPSANRNRLIPMLHADLKPDAANTYPDNEVFMVSHGSAVFGLLIPLLRQLLIEVRKDGGLRPPQTNAERSYIVTVYRQLAKMGLIYNQGYSARDALTLAALIYVVLEYQKLWESYKGQFPLGWSGNHCVPAERDNIRVKDQFCVPKEDLSPHTSDHKEWLYQLAQCAKSYVNNKYLEVDPDIPVDIRKLIEDTARLVP